MKKRIFVVLTIIIVVSGSISFSMLTRGHNWGGDFAQYLMQARAIATGTIDEFAQWMAFTMNESERALAPITYPWGLPLLLAPVYSIVGFKILALKLVLLACYMMYLIIFFFFSRRRLSDTEALLLTAFFAFNPTLIRYPNSILSDIPFLLFSTLCILLIDIYFNQYKRKFMGLAVGIIIYLASLFRTNGILLFIPLFVTQVIFVMRETKTGNKLKPTLLLAVVPYLTFGIFVFIEKQITNSINISSLNQNIPTIQQFVSETTFQTLRHNLVYYFWLPTSLFNEITKYQTPLYLFFLFFSIVNLSEHNIRNLPIHAFIFSTLLIYIINVHIQGIRYIFPILPFFIVFAFGGMKSGILWFKEIYKKRATRMLSIFFAFLVLIAIISSIDLAEKNLAANRFVKGPYDNINYWMFRYIRTEIPAESIIVFWKPRVMRLLSDHNSFFTNRCEDLPKGDYLVYDNKVYNNQGKYDQIKAENLDSCNLFVNLTPIKNLDYYTIYKIDRLDNSTLIKTKEE